ncbi:MAG: exodeoxyribonuclease I [Candidatus Nomurabacteria bacterium]|jgi:exodeoxyribonuclease-1|nr:exodeoxyribonuclease I [Candidatus Nomurabacteria bacterium]
MASFFFYDLETSGLNPRYDRIMQFAGQRTDMDLRPLGEPYNLLVKLPEDILPSPEALLVTGITPQQTARDGVQEPELCRLLMDEIFTPGTIAVGFNNIRFDDEFIRHTLWRNFYDPYEWSWSEERSRWDLLDVVRLTRALRPDGIKWSTDKNGKSVNKLESLAHDNKLNHEKAHDALSDVTALIAITKLIHERQLKLYDYLLNMRDKKEVAKLVNLDDPTPFVYASGRYNAEFEKATVALPIAPGSKPGSVLVYNLRFDPDAVKFDDKAERPWLGLPVKELQYNRCPAVAPLGVLDKTSQKRLSLSLKTIQGNLDKLQKNRGVIDKVIDIWRARPDFPPAPDVEGRLYDSFTTDSDKPRVKTVRESDADALADLHPKFDDERLPELLLRYKARNFPTALSEDEQSTWESYRRTKLERELPGYFNRLAQLAAADADPFVLEEIQLWVESILPVDE